MTVIKNVNLDFWDFLKKLYLLMGKDGVLRDVIIDKCAITGIPQNVPAYIYTKSKKFMGFTVRSINDKFFGIQSDNVTVTNCSFDYRKKKDIKNSLSENEKIVAREFNKKS